MKTVREILSESKDILEIGQALYYNKLETTLSPICGMKTNVYTSNLKKSANVISAIQNTVLLVKDMIQFIHQAKEILNREAEGSALIMKGTILLDQLWMQDVFVVSETSSLTLGDAFEMLDAVSTDIEDERKYVTECQGKEPDANYVYHAQKLCPKALLDMVLNQPVLLDVAQSVGGANNARDN